MYQPFTPGLSSRLFGEVVGQTTSGNGFVGCMSSLDLDGHTWPLLKDAVNIEERFQKDVVKGCVG